MREYDAEATRWLDNIPHEKWAQPFDNEGLRYGHMSTNLGEFVNSILKGVRHLPITALVKSTYFLLAKLFVRKGIRALAQTTSNVLRSTNKTIQKNQQLAGNIYVRQFDHKGNCFMVDEIAPPHHGGMASSYLIDLRA